MKLLIQKALQLKNERNHKHRKHYLYGMKIKVRDLYYNPRNEKLEFMKALRNWNEKLKSTKALPCMNEKKL